MAFSTRDGSPEPALHALPELRQMPASLNALTRAPFHAPHEKRREAGQPVRRVARQLHVGEGRQVAYQFIPQVREICRVAIHMADGFLERLGHADSTRDVRRAGAFALLLPAAI